MPPFAAGIVLCSTILHAGWNLAAKRRSDSWTALLQILAVISVPGLLFAAAAELFGDRLLPHVWPHLLGAGCAQAVYFLGLTLGYRAGDMGVVYPVTRALPVLFLGGFDLLRNLSPSPFGWLGLALVAAGCIVISKGARGERGAAVGGRPARRLGRRLHPTLGWAAVGAAGTVGYTAFDKLAAEVMLRASGGGLFDAFRYGLWEFVLSTALYAALLAAAMRIDARRRRAAALPAAPSATRAASSPAAPPAAALPTGPAAGHPPAPRSAGPRIPPADPSAASPAASPCAPAGRRFRWPPAPDWRTVAAAGSMAGAYTLVLWAYQLSERASYVVALRQFSIVLGVAAGAVLMRERAPVVRIGAALVIVAGIALVSAAP